MSVKDTRRGYHELRAARRLSLGLLLTVFLFSIFVNILMLTGPLYMLQVYDRVLGSRSEETLLALSVLVTFLFIAMGLLDHARSRIMARIGARFQDRLDRRVFEASVRRLSVAPGDPAAISAQRDLESIQRLWASQVLTALFDLPWTPLFFAAIFIFHPWMGWLAIGGGVILVLVTLLNQRMSEAPMQLATHLSLQAERFADNLKAEAEVVRALGMSGNGFDRWYRARSDALGQNIQASDLTGVFGVLSKTLRLFLQSAMLGLGAYLVLQQELSAGAMIAGSILMGRALAPFEVAIGQWSVVQRAREGWGRLADLFTVSELDGAKSEGLGLPVCRLILEAMGGGFTWGAAVLRV